MEGRGGDKTEPESEETGKDKIDRQVLMELNKPIHKFRACLERIPTEN